MSGNRGVTDHDDDRYMRPQAFDRTGILILHIWLEDGVSEGFRARITQTLDSLSQDKQVATAASTEDVYTAVRAWMEAFVNPN